MGEDLLRPPGPEYDEWYYGGGQFSAVQRPGVDSALRGVVEPESVEERILSDGSRWEVYKRLVAVAAP